MAKKQKMDRLGKRIIKALDEALEGKVTRYKPAPDVKEMREKLGMEREQFANAFNLSKYSVRNWELGVRQPHGPALTLLYIIQADPLKAYRMLYPKKR